jgi:sugar lactone lactonase YvrE
MESKHVRLSRTRLVYGCLAGVIAVSQATLARCDESPADLLGIMYWTYRDEGVYRAARDGSDPKLLVAAKDVDGLAVDSARQTMYWTISGAGPNKVQKSKLDGTQVQDVLTDLTATGDLLLDADAGKLYVTLMDEGKIIEVNTDGSQRRDFVTGLSAPDELALDAEHRTLYVTCSGNSTIQRLKLDDPVPQTIMTTQGIFFGLALDMARGQLYCIQPSRGILYRADLDGSDAKPVISGLNDPDGLALDSENNKLYWTERGKISQANLDGSNIEVLLTGKVAQYGSVVVLPPKE